MSESNSIPVVEIEGLTKDYRQGEVDIHALRGIDLVVQKSVIPLTIT